MSIAPQIAPAQMSMRVQPTAQRLAKKLDSDPKAKAAAISAYEAKTGNHVLDADKAVTWSFMREDRPGVQENSGILPWHLVENPEYTPKRLPPNTVTCSNVKNQHCLHLNCWLYSCKLWLGTATRNKFQLLLKKSSNLNNKPLTLISSLHIHILLYIFNIL